MRHGGGTVMSSFAVFTMGSALSLSPLCLISIIVLCRGFHTYHGVWNQQTTFGIWFSPSVVGAKAPSQVVKPTW